MTAALDFLRTALSAEPGRDIDGSGQGLGSPGLELHQGLPVDSQQEVTIPREDELFLLFEANRAHYARVIDPSGGWTDIGGSQGPYGPFLGMPAVGVADLDGNGCGDLVFVLGPVYRNWIIAWDECRNVNTYVSGDRNEVWIDVAAGDVDADGRDELFLLYEASGFRYARVIDPSGGWTDIGGSQEAYGPFLGMPAVGVADLDGNGCGDLVFVLGPLYGNQIVAWDECRNVNTYASGNRGEWWIDVAAGDVDADGRDELFLLYEASGFRYARVIDPSGGWTDIGGSQEAYGPFLGMPAVGVADLDGNGCGDLVFVLGPLYGNQIVAWDECRNVNTYASGNRGEVWIDVAAGDLDGTFVEEEKVDDGVTYIPKVPYAVLHDPSGSGSYSYLKKSTSNTLSAQFSLSVGVGVSVEAEAEAFGNGAGASAGVTFTATLTEGMEIRYTTTDEFRSSESTDKDHIGPGYGDVFWGEAWEVHWELWQRRVHSGGTVTVVPVYRYSVVRLSEFIIDAFWVKQNLEKQWRDFLLGFDIGAENQSPSVARAALLENIFFTTGMRRSRDVTITETSTIEVELKLEIEASAFAKLGFNIGVVKVGGKVEITVKLTMGAKFSATHTSGKSVGYEFHDHESSDPRDTADEISLAVYGDKAFGTYHFLTKTSESYTSLPHEHWTRKADQVPPTISSVIVVPNPVQSGQPATIRAHISDLGGVSRAEARLYREGNTVLVRTVPMLSLGGSTYEAVLDTSGLEWRYTIRVYAEDVDGNGVLSQDSPLLTVQGGVPPEVVLKDPKNGFAGNWNRPRFAWEAADSGSGVREIRFRVCEDASQTTCFPARTFSPGRTSYQWGSGGEGPLADRDWWWFIEAEDFAGNTKRVSSSFRNTAPQPFTLHVPNPSDVSRCSVTLRWTASPDPSLRGYEPAFAPPGGTWTQLGTVGTTQYTVGGLLPGTTYQFRVASVDDVQARYTAGPVSATTLPFAPPNLGFALVEIGKTFISMSWSKYAECDFASYNVYRVVGHSDFTPDDRQGGNRIFTTGNRDVIYYYDSGLSACTKYTYKLKLKTTSGGEATSPATYAETICKARFQGYVMWANGYPGFATITVRDPTTGAVLWTGTTDSDGYYESKEFLVDRTYDLTAAGSCWSETRRSVYPGWHHFTIISDCI